MSRWICAAMFYLGCTSALAGEQPWDRPFYIEPTPPEQPKPQSAETFSALRDLGAAIDANHAGPCGGVSGFAACMHQAQQRLYDGVYGAGGMRANRNAAGNGLDSGNYCNKAAGGCSAVVLGH